MTDCWLATPNTDTLLIQAAEDKEKTEIFSESKTYG